MPMLPNPTAPGRAGAAAQPVLIAIRPAAEQRLPDSDLIDRIVDSFLADPQARRFELRVLPAPRPRELHA